MNTSHEERLLRWRPVLLVLLGWLMLGGCLPTSIPLASLLMEQPMATGLNPTGIDQYQADQWMKAFGSFDAALQIDPDFVEAILMRDWYCMRWIDKRSRPGIFDEQGNWILGAWRWFTPRYIGIIWDCLRLSIAT